MSADDARAFWTIAPGRGEIRAEPLAPPEFGDVLVRALYSGISRGTERLVFQGRVPPSEYQRMRAPFQSGEFPAPVKYGYASVGRIEDGPEDLRDRDVFVLYPASDALRRSGRGGPRAAGGGSGGARRAGREPRDRHQRAVGRRAEPGRSDQRGRRRHGGMPGRVAGGTRARLRRRAGRHQPAARHDCAQRWACDLPRPSTHRRMPTW